MTRQDSDSDDRSMRDQYDSLAALIDAGGASEAKHDVGEFGEDVSGGFIETIGGGHLLEQHTPGDKPQGIDKMYVTEDGAVHVAEDKTIGSGEYHAPYMSKTVDGRQADDEWVSRNSAETQLDIAPDEVGADADQVSTEVFQTDILGGTFGRFDVNSSGKVDAEPSEMYSLSDIIDVIDATNFESATAEDTESSDDSDGEAEAS